MSEPMVPVVIKMPPELLAQIKQAAATARNPKSWKGPGVTVGAWVRKAIAEKIAHRERSTTRPSTKR